MVSDYSFERDVTTPEEFEAVLGDLLAAALDNDVDVRGSWVYTDGEVGSDVEVQFFKLDADGETD